MVELYREWHTIDKPRAWVRRVAARLWWRQLERDHIEVPHAEIAAAKVPALISLLSQDEAKGIENGHPFLSLLGNLSKTRREVLAWTYDGYTPTEIASLTGKPAATVRANLRDARAALRRQFEASDVQETT